MNRIYQGRVSKVEIPDGKDEQGKPKRKKLDDGEPALWQHHQLFQDAVNYYLLALLSLARDTANPATPIRMRMNDAASEHQIWTSFRRRGQTRSGMRDSVAKYICPGKTEPTLEECFANVLDGNKENPDVLDLALQELLDECDGDGAIQQEGRSMLPRFCWPEFTGAFPYDAAGGIRQTGEERLSSELHTLQTPDEFKKFADEISLLWVVNRDKTGGNFTDEKARQRLQKAASHFLQAFGDTEATSQMGDNVRAYDISDPKRLRKVARSLEGFGVRLQYSVFECPLDDLRLAKLKAELQELLNHDEDQVLFVSLGSTSNDASLIIDAMGLPYEIRSRVTII